MRRQSANSVPTESDRVARVETLERRQLLANQELLSNNSFTSGTASWTLSGDFWAGTNLNNWRTAPGYAAGGVDSAGTPKNNASGSLNQPFIAVPSNATSAIFSFYLNVSSNETTTSQFFDKLQVNIIRSNGTRDPLFLFSNLDRTSFPAYGRVSINLISQARDYRGQTGRVEFVATTDFSRTTVFRLDDINVLVTVPDNGPPTISSVSDTPDPVTQGDSVTLRGENVADPDGNLSSVSFYRESNGIGGLQTASDALVRTDSTSPYTATQSTQGFASGLYTYYAQAKDSNGALSSVALTTNTVKLPEPVDLIGNAFAYVVPRDATEQSNGPLPVNEAFNVTVFIKNLGTGTAPSSEVAIYASQNSTIDPQNDYFIESESVASLTGGQQRQINLNGLHLPPGAQSNLFGRMYIGAVVDADDEVAEINETNNRNRGDSIDRQPVQLYDRTMPTSEAAGFASYRSALLWLFRNGYTPVPPGFGSGFARPLSTAVEVRSPFDGEVRSGVAYRQNAFIRDPDAQHGNQHWIRIQGSTTVAEPNPLTAIFYGTAWFAYVEDWHTRF